MALSRSSMIFLSVVLSMLFPWLYRFFFSAPDPNARYFLSAYHGNLVELQQLYAYSTDPNTPASSLLPSSQSSDSASPAVPPPRVNFFTLRDRWNNSLLHWAAKSSSPLNVQVMEFLLHTVSPPLLPLLGEPNSAGSYPLHWAVYSDSPELIALMIKSGAPINATNSQGESALHWAVHWQKPSAVTTLLSSGVNKHQSDLYGNTAFHKLPEDCMETPLCKDILTTLLDHQLNVLAENQSKRTPLMRLNVAEKDVELGKKVQEMEEKWRKELGIESKQTGAGSNQRQGHQQPQPEVMSEADMKRVEAELKAFQDQIGQEFNKV
jgi:ankyrin repeat protein